MCPATLYGGLQGLCTAYALLHLSRAAETSEVAVTRCPCRHTRLVNSVCQALWSISDHILSSVDD